MCRGVLSWSATAYSGVWVWVWVCAMGGAKVEGVWDVGRGLSEGDLLDLLRDERAGGESEIRGAAGGV